MEHAWCRDPSRDERVRAAEDGRTAPLPTLEECIEGQKQLQTARPCGGTDPAPSRGERGAADTCMQTERVTLEITHDGKHGPVSTWPFECGSHGKCVRVVEEAHFDDLAQVAMERDAAIRERDAAVAESERRLRLCETMKRDGDSARFHAAVAQARVAELEAASGGGEGEPVAWEYDIPTPHGTGRGVSNLDPRKHPEVWQQGTGVPATDARPLYRSPPQPRGWLTGEERRFVHWWAYENREPTDKELDAFKIAAKALLARSTPPEVVLPDWVKMCVSHGRQNQLLAALAAAGVEVEEVGRE